MNWINSNLSGEKLISVSPRENQRDREKDLPRKI